jgi:DNA-binding MarR family transcriptional regulator
MATVTPNIADERIDHYSRLVETQRRLHAIFGRTLRDRAGISPVWYEAMLRIGRSPEEHLPITELGEAMQLSSGGATRLVDRLEETGYVERTACPEDRRVWWVTLTDRGREALVEATGVHLEDLEEHLTSRLSADELDMLAGLLRRIRPEA